MARNFCMVLKTAFHMSGGLFWRQEMPWRKLPVSWRNELTKNSCQAVFSRVMMIFEKSSCFIVVFRVRAEELRFLSQFLAAFRKLHSLCFKVKNTKLSPVNFGPWVKDYETIGCVSFGRALKYAFWLSRWKTNRSKNI